jgi:MFS family permease
MLSTHTVHNRLFYGWIIVGVSFVTLGISFGIWYSFSVFFVAMLKEFGWSRAATAGVFSLFMIVQSGVAILIGSFLDRFGPRKVLPLGSILIVVGLLATSRATALWQVYLFYGVVTALGICAIGYPSHSIFLPNWFVKRRGLAIGIAMAGIGIGMQVLVPFVQYLIGHYGWRTAYCVLAAVVLLVVIPLNGIFQRKNPEEMGLLPDGEPGENPERTEGSGGSPTSAPQSDDRGWTLGKTLKTSRYWFLFLTFFFTPMAIQGILIHQVAHVVDKGFSPERGAVIFGLAGILGSVGKILFGSLSDRIGREMAFSIGMGCTFFGVLSLMILEPGGGLLLYAYALLFGLGYGSIAPIFPAHAADLFHGPHFGKIYGSLSIAGGVGGAAGTWLSGKIFDWTASYRMAFIMVLSSIVLMVILFWFTSTPGKRSRGRRVAREGGP